MFNTGPAMHNLPNTLYSLDSILFFFIIAFYLYESTIILIVWFFLTLLKQVQFLQALLCIQSAHTVPSNAVQFLLSQQNVFMIKGCYDR